MGADVSRGAERDRHTVAAGFAAEKATAVRAAAGRENRRMARHMFIARLARLA